MTKIFTSTLLLTLAACAGPFEPIVHCDPIGDAEPLCGWQNPEDLARLPGGSHVLVSEYGDMTGKLPGSLAFLDLQTHERIVAFEGADIDGPGPWGDPSCPGAPGAEFSPHGIHVGQRPDGAWQALAIQHAGRESVEFFEIVDGPALQWRGCALPPDGLLNDVVATPEGGFLATRMMPKRGGLGPLFAFLDAQWFDHGAFVWSWDPNDGFEVVPGTEGGLANGLALDEDGTTLFVAYSLSGELRRLNRTNGEVQSSVFLDPTDNLTWTPDGWLVAATALAKKSTMRRCMQIEEGTCPSEHALVAVDPETGASDTLYVGGPGTPGGAGTTGLVLEDGSLLVGTYAGDRIVRVNDVW
ncbi:MAG: hypothetical protein KTR31_23785 [Myxococcales bacterium]|nr:hypothetical protein [Myxococcales bacterium]